MSMFSIKAQNLSTAITIRIINIIIIINEYLCRIIHQNSHSAMKLLDAGDRTPDAQINCSEYFSLPDLLACS